MQRKRLDEQVDAGALEGSEIRYLLRGRRGKINRLHSTNQRYVYCDSP